MIIIYITREEKKYKSNEEISKELNIDFFINTDGEAEENEIMEKLYDFKDCGAKRKESKSSGSSNHSVIRKKKIEMKVRIKKKKNQKKK